jgi:hypothetical protein
MVDGIVQIPAERDRVCSVDGVSGERSYCWNSQMALSERVSFNIDLQLNLTGKDNN